jgi:hypothetical protein
MWLDMVAVYGYRSPNGSRSAKLSLRPTAGQLSDLHLSGNKRDVCAFQDKHEADVDLLLEPLLQSTLAESVRLPLPPGNRQGQGALQQAAPPDAAPDAADF